MRALIRSLIEGMSSAIHECADGETAVELYSSLHPDWVLMDIKMSGMDGIAATQAIRTSDPAARIIIVTEQPEAEYGRAASAAGASGFLGKENLLELPRLLAAGGAS
jgi:CheY-like chemotaxis protein